MHDSIVHSAGRESQRGGVARIFEWEWDRFLILHGSVVTL